MFRKGCPKGCPFFVLLYFIPFSKNSGGKQKFIPNCIFSKSSLMPENTDKQ